MVDISTNGESKQLNAYLRRTELFITYTRLTWAVSKICGAVLLACCSSESEDAKVVQVFLLLYAQIPCFSENTGFVSTLRAATCDESLFLRLSVLCSKGGHDLYHSLPV